MTQTLTWSKRYLVHSLIKKCYAVHFCTVVGESRHFSQSEHYSAELFTWLVMHLCLWVIVMVGKATNVSKSFVCQLIF